MPVLIHAKYTLKRSDQLQNEKYGSANKQG